MFSLLKWQKFDNNKITFGLTDVDWRNTPVSVNQKEFRKPIVDSPLATRLAQIAVEHELHFASPGSMFTSPCTSRTFLRWPRIQQTKHLNTKFARCNSFINNKNRYLKKILSVLLLYNYLQNNCGIFLLCGIVHKVIFYWRRTSLTKPWRKQL